MGGAFFGNKTISIYQRRYLGSKTKLLSFIDEILERENIEFQSFADIFAGTGTVANHFYGRSKVIINDILDSNNNIYRAFFGKDPIREEKLRERLHRYNNIDVKNYNENYFSQNFSDTYFDANNAKKIGIIRDDIQKLFIEGIITPREKSYLLTSLIYALDKIANTVGHYDAYRRIDIPAKRLFLLPLDLTTSQFDAEIYKDDANELVKKIKADIIYIDPPYNSRQYCDAYHLLENVATWKKEKIFGVAKKIDRSHIKSQYNMKSASAAFSDLIGNIDAKYILVSYNDMRTSGNSRSQSRISDDEILSALKRKGTVRIFETPFKQFTTGKSSKNDLRERIFLCKVNVATKPSKILIIPNRKPITSNFVKSPLNYTGGKHRLLPQITELFPQDIHTFYDVFAGGANVGINAKAQNIVCVENNEYVVNLLRFIQRKNFEDLNHQVMDIINEFSLSQSYIKGYDYYNTDSSTGLSRHNKEPFLKLREEFNKDKNRIDLLLVLILYSFNNQIRFNQRGDFNLPVGKRDYNGSSRINLATFNQASNEKKISFNICDFRNIEKFAIANHDFVYLDPPYLLGLATYNELGGWTEKDERDLYTLLVELNNKNVRFALSNVLAHKGESNEIMKSWVKNNNFVVHKLNYNYKNSNYHSSAKNNTTSEVLVTNY